MSGARRFVLFSAGAAVIWYVCILVFWALQPLSDAVPIGVDYTLKPPAFVSANVHCNGLFESAARGSTPLPALKPQPNGSPKLGYQRDACAIVHHQARLVFALDTAVVVVALFGAGWFVAWRPKASARRAGTDAVLATTVAG